jgi:hypothetical protein
MRHGYTDRGGAKSSTQRAGRVALHHDKAYVRDSWREPPRDEPDMSMRVRLAGTAEVGQRIFAQAVFGWPKMRMLTGEQDTRDDAAPRQCLRQWSKLDRLRTGPDD